MTKTESIVTTLMMMPFMVAAVGALWVGLGLLIYAVYKWLFDRR